MPFIIKLGKIAKEKDVEIMYLYNEAPWMSKNLF